jgi:hypothetical protein
MSVERSPTRSDGLDHGQAAELCLGNTAELGVIERGVEGERLFQIGDPELECSMRMFGRLGRPPPGCRRIRKPVGLRTSSYHDVEGWQ